MPHGHDSINDAPIMMRAERVDHDMTNVYEHLNLNSHCMLEEPSIPAPVLVSIMQIHNLQQAKAQTRRVGTVLCALTLSASAYSLRPHAPALAAACFTCAYSAV